MTNDRGGLRTWDKTCENKVPVTLAFEPRQGYAWNGNGWKTCDARCVAPVLRVRRAPRQGRGREGARTLRAALPVGDQGDARGPRQAG